MVLFLKTWFDWKFLPQKGILKTTKNYPTLLARCDQASCPKFNHKIPVERGHPYLSLDTLWCKISLLFWPHWPLLQPGAKRKMKKWGVICPYHQRSLVNSIMIVIIIVHNIFCLTLTNIFWPYQEPLRIQWASLVRRTRPRSRTNLHG